MHKLVKRKNANHHFAYLRTFEFVHLHYTGVIEQDPSPDFIYKRGNIRLYTVKKEDDL